MKSSTLILQRFTFLLGIFLFAAVLSPQTLLATHCEATFNQDRTADLPPAGVWGTMSGDCPSPGCNDYFDYYLCANQTATLSFCQMGGTAGFDTGLSVWGGPGFANVLECKEDICGALSELVFTAPAAGVYRFRVGGFQFANGQYTLALNLPVDCTGGEIPTLSQWGLIILALLLLSFGTVYAMRRQSILAGVGGSHVSNQGIPFNGKTFGKVLMICGLGVASIFVVAILGFGYELTSADIPGSLMAIPLLAYLIHLVIPVKE